MRIEGVLKSLKRSDERGILPENEGGKGQFSCQGDSPRDFSCGTYCSEDGHSPPS